MDSLEQAREALKDCITLIEGWSHRWTGEGNHPQTVVANARDTFAALSRPVEGVKGGALMERFFAMMNPPLTEGEKSVAALAFGFALAAPPVADSEALRERVVIAAKQSREVFEDYGSRAREAIDYMEQVLLAEARLAQGKAPAPAVTDAMVSRGHRAWGAAIRQMSDITIKMTTGQEHKALQAALEAALHPQSAAGEEGKP